jgi:hypothetical protein
MTLIRLVPALAALVLSDAGCTRRSSDEASPSGADASAASARIASCDRVTSMSVCSEYAGAYLAQNEPYLSTNCGKLAGTFVIAACPNTAVLGSCELSTGEMRRFYGSGDSAYDAPRAEGECTGAYKGTWRPFP